MKGITHFLLLGLVLCFLSGYCTVAYASIGPDGKEYEKTEGTWTETEQGRRFTDASGTAYVGRWLYSTKGNWYYLDQNGYALKNFQTVEGKRRFFDPSLGSLKTSFFVYEEYLYCGNSDTGEILTSLNGGNNSGHSRSGVKYVFDGQGHATNPEGKWDPTTLKELAQSRADIKTWEKENGKWVYYENGQKLTNAWHGESGYWFYFDENGEMVKSAVREIDGVKYYFNVTGEMKTKGTARDKDGVEYRVRPDGSLSREDAEAEKAAQEAKRRLENDYALNGQLQHLNSIANPYEHSNTVQWFNATYAILTKSNGRNIRAVGGSLKVAGVDGMSSEYDEAESKTIKTLLVSSWGVTDRASADRVLNSLVDSGNATGSAWDYSRAMSNLGYYYLAGYYSIQETLDKSLEVARVIQTKFGSWDEFVNSYLAGYSAWSGQGEAERRYIYDSLKGSAFNPYALDWNMELKKEW